MVFRTDIFRKLSLGAPEVASLRSHYEVRTTDNNKTAPSSSTRRNEISLLPVKTLSHRTNSDYGLAYLGISASKHQFHKNVWCLLLLLLLLLLVLLVLLLLQAQLNSRKNLRTAFPFWRLLFEMNFVTTCPPIDRDYYCYCLSFFAARRYLDFLKLPIHIINKLFNTLFFPILTYCSEVWESMIKVIIAAGIKN